MRVVVLRLLRRREVTRRRSSGVTPYTSLLAVLLLLGGALPTGAQDIRDQPLFPQKPAPPSLLHLQDLEGLSNTIPGVPEYIWWYGCSPTSGGMIIAWWDAQPGCGDLYPGSAATWYGNGSTGTKRIVAAQAHIDAGVALSLSYGSYMGHTADCLADFMETYNGGSYRSNIGPGLVDYCAWDNPATPEYESYVATYTTNWTAAGWDYDDYCAEIDAGRPVHLGLTGDRGGHSVVGVGYDNTGGKQNYICWTTWSGWGVRSWGWEGESETGDNYKVYAATYLRVTPYSNNRPPTAPTMVSITPAAPVAAEALTGSATGSSDPDGNDLAYEYQWAKSANSGGAWGGWTLTGAILPADSTAKGDWWKLRARASDGFVASDWTESDPVAINPNARPLPATEATITPVSPAADQNLTATATGASDPDGDPFTYRYRWYKSTDGGANWTDTPSLWGAVLKADQTAKGEQWKVRTQAYDGEEVSLSTYSDPVTIGNVRPLPATETTITPASPAADQNLTAAAIGASDPDGDPFTYRYRWYKSTDGGANWTDTPSLWGEVLKADQTAKGEQWKVRTQAYDGEEVSLSTYSDPVTIGNGRPLPATEVTITPASPAADQNLTAAATGASDPDGDGFTYRYRWYKSTDGGANWTDTPSLWGAVLKADQTAKGEQWKVRAQAYDGQDVSLSTYSDPITIGNVRPQPATEVTITPSTPTAGQDLRAAATGASDPDGDPFTYRYRWYKSTDGGANWTDTPSLWGEVLKADQTAEGELWKVRAQAYDGQDVSLSRYSDPVTIGGNGSVALMATMVATSQAGRAQITVNLTAAADVGVSVCNIAGREVAVLPPQQLGAGISTLWWNGRSTSGTAVPPGQYLLRLTAHAKDGRCASYLAPLRR